MSGPDLLHPDIETLAPDALRRMQDRYWETQWEYVRSHSAFYRARWGRLARRTLTLDSLQDLPLTEKEEVRASGERRWPYGEHVACDPKQIVRIHRTSGTTGRALIIANSRADAAIVAEQGARGMYASGLRPGHRVVHCLNYCMWTGGLTDHLALEGTGATVLPYGTGNTHALIEAIRSLGIDAISCTPSYPALLERVLREEFALEPRALGLKLALFGGEAGLDNAAFREGLENTWGFAVRNANFGLSEVMSIMGSQCEHGTELHFLGGDAVFAELLDPASGQRLAIEPGATGELVCTHLRKECQPLVRYRTRDVVTVVTADRCGCGRTMWRFRVAGRTDDMFNVRGVNVFPTAVQRVIAELPQLASGHFRVRLRGPGPYDRLRVRAEAARELDAGAREDAARTIERALRAAIGATAEVELVGFESLPRTDGKTSLIEREDA